MGAPADTVPLPTEIQVEVTGACNLACRMCLVRYRPKLGRRVGAMCLHTFTELIDALPGVEKITLQGLGEPLLAPDIFEMIDLAAGRGARVGFNTNGVLLTPETGDRLVRAGLDWLHVSLDGATAATYEGIRAGSSFARVCDNIAALVGTRERLKTVSPTISLVFVAMRRNIAELSELVRLTTSLGVEKLWVQNLSHSFDDTDPAGAYREIRSFAEAEALWVDADESARRAFSDARQLARELGVELRLPRLEAPPREQPPDGRGCHWPFESAYITHDGKVQPCCMVMGAERAVLGRLDEADFAQIWAGEPYERFRAGLLSGGEAPDVCRGCSLYRRVF